MKASSEHQQTGPSLSNKQPSSAEREPPVHSRKELQAPADMQAQTPSFRWPLYSKTILKMKFSPYSKIKGAGFYISVDIVLAYGRKRIMNRSIKIFCAKTRTNDIFCGDY